MALQNNRIRSTALRLLLGVALGGVVFILHLTAPGQSFEEWTRDIRLRMRPPASPSDSIRLVGIDDSDLENFGEWPIPRGIHSDILKILTAMKAKGIVFDILFTNPSSNPDQDAALDSTIADSPGVILPYYYQGSSTQESEHFLPGSRYGISTSEVDWLEGQNPSIPFFRSASAYGATNVVPDQGDEIIRRIPLFIETGKRLFPTLSMQAVIKALGANDDQVRITPGDHVEIVDTPRGTVIIPIDNEGYYRVNFHSGLETFKPSFSYTHLYNAVSDSETAEVITGLVHGRTVIVGDVTTGSSDLVTTPVGRIPGVLVHATAISNILSGDHLRIPPHRMTLLGCLSLGGLCSVLFASRRLALVLAMIAVACAIPVYASFKCAEKNLLLPLTPAILVGLLTGATRVSLQVVEARTSENRVKRILAPFIDRSVFADVLETGSAVRKAERRELTVVFSDIRGFTAWTEKQDPDEVTRVLNEYFQEMIPIVHRHGGTVDKLMGDGMMLFVGAPKTIPNHAQVAVKIAMEMRAKAVEMASSLDEEARDSFRIGIGIHSGFVTVGTFGAAELLDYTIIGRTVNLAARIEGACPPGKILITSRTKALAGPLLETCKFGIVEFKGIAEPTELHEVIGFKTHDGGT